MYDTIDVYSPNGFLICLEIHRNIIENCIEYNILEFILSDQLRPTMISVLSYLNCVLIFIRKPSIISIRLCCSQ